MNYNKKTHTKVTATLLCVSLEIAVTYGMTSRKQSRDLTAMLSHGKKEKLATNKKAYSKID